jgi:hypothetical protein
VLAFFEECYRNTTTCVHAQPDAQLQLEADVKCDGQNVSWPQCSLNAYPWPTSLLQHCLQWYGCNATLRHLCMLGCTVMMMIRLHGGHTWLCGNCARTAVSELLTCTDQHGGTAIVLRAFGMNLHRDLSNNHLSGTLPSEWASLQNLVDM